jgi:ribosomal protein L29
MTIIHATKDLLRMTPVELQKEISSSRSELARLRLAIEMQGEKNHAKYRTLRRSIARMLTVATMQEKATQEKGGAEEKKAPKKAVTKVSSRKTSQKPKKPVQGSRA